MRRLHDRVYFDELPVVAKARDRDVVTAHDTAVVERTLPGDPDNCMPATDVTAFPGSAVRPTRAALHRHTVFSVRIG